MGASSHPSPAIGGAIPFCRRWMDHQAAVHFDDFMSSLSRRFRSSKNNLSPLLTASDFGMPANRSLSRASSSSSGNSDAYEDLLAALVIRERDRDDHLDPLLLDGGGHDHAPFLSSASIVRLLPAILARVSINSRLICLSSLARRIPF